jgi:hypothetical protein
MIIKDRIIAILLVVIMVVSILGITVPNYFSVSNQFFSIEVVSQNNTPLQNVSVQGDIIAPISSHTGWNTIFSGITSSSGKFSTSNLTSLMKIGEEWKYALGPLITGSSPTITLFLTYSDNRGIYFKESSIYGAAQSGLVSDLLSGKSFSKTLYSIFLETLFSWPEFQAGKHCRTRQQHPSTGWAIQISLVGG